MTLVSRSRRVDASPSAVWSVLADFDRIVEWAPDVDHSSWLTARTEGIGASRRVQVAAMTLVETVTRWDEEATLAYTITGLPPVVSRVENRWDLQADGSATTVTLTVDVTPGPRPPMKLAAKAVTRRLAAANMKMLDALAAAARRVEDS